MKETVCFDKKLYENSNFTTEKNLRDDYVNLKVSLTLMFFQTASRSQ